MIKQNEKFRKHCLWRGLDVNCKQPPKATWKLVCVPKENGGLGVLNLYTQNESRLLKHLHKFSTNKASFGYNWFGIAITLLVMYQSTIKRGPFGERKTSSF